MRSVYIAASDSFIEDHDTGDEDPAIPPMHTVFVTAISGGIPIWAHDWPPPPVESINAQIRAYCDEVDARMRARKRGDR